MRRLTITSATILLVLVAVSHAQVPQTLSYQGVLRDASGTPVPDDDYLVTFRLYDVESGGTALWTEPQTLPVSGGILSATLGSVVTLDLAADVPYWLGISVGSEEELDTRVELTSTPYALRAADSDLLGGEEPGAYSLGGHEHDDRYRTETELGTSDGSDPNVGSNYVSWDNLTDVPAGLADGVEDEGGSGDGHSLDAADGSPTDVVYVDGSGIVTYQNVFTPDMRLKSTGGGDVSFSFIRPSANYGDFRFLNDGGKMYLQYDVDDGASWETTHHLNYDGALGLGRTVVTGSRMLDVGGDARVAGQLVVGEDGFADGRLDLYRNGTATQIVSMDDDSDRGGRVTGYDESGHKTYELYPSPEGMGGGRLLVTRNYLESTGFYVNANDNNTQATTMSVYGPSRSAHLIMRNDGDDSVVLPHDAISAEEMLDEPGCASAGFYGEILLGEDPIALEWVTVDAPASGYALVVGTALSIIDHTQLSLMPSRAEFGVSTSPTTFPLSQRFTLLIHYSMPSYNWYALPITVHGLFPASAGSNTYYLMGEEINGECEWVVTNVQLSAIYVPTAYGSIYSPALAGASDSDGWQTSVVNEAATRGRMESDEAASLAANQARIDRELAEMRAEMERLRAELE